jgi:RNA polymerase sigma-70 factor (ECF subfamily)
MDGSQGVGLVMGEARPRFEDVALPHLDAAYNLARWLTRSDADASDVVQEACLRALTYFEGYRGENGKAWLLTIVRNTCYRWMERNRPAVVVSLSPEIEGEVDDAATLRGAAPPDPEAMLLQQRDARLLNDLMAELPHLFREVLVLRELEDMSYREISDVLGVPLGTVMSRLARARGLLKEAWERRSLRSGNGGT